MKNIKRRGQILAEVVIAIGLLALILVGMSELISRSTVSTRLSKQKDEGARLVEARLSYFRQERDRDAANFFNSLALETEGFVDCVSDPWVSTTFACAEKFTNLADSSGVLIEVRASWANRDANDTNVTLSTIISRP